MKPTLSLSYRAMLIAGALLTTAPAAMAADPVVVQTEVRQTEALSASRGDSRVQTRLAGDFTAFAGSEENARNLFTGLRNGTSITLNSTTISGGATTTNQLNFDTPTKPMGNGNVFISLALAKQQLASYGITDPTPQQIQAALTGGTIIPSDPAVKPVVLTGVLTQRASGMGWGEIAKSQGTNLGPVVSGLKNHNAGIITGATVATTNTGITTATGAAVQSGANVSANGNSANAPGHNRGSGIVSATGGALGSGLNANANAQGARAGGLGAGIVTAGGGAATARGGANAQGQGKGLLRN